MIPAHPDILSRIVHCTALTYEDVAGLDNLISELFDSQSFAV